MKRTVLCVLVAVLATMAITGVMLAANDRYYTAEINPSNVAPGGAPTNFNLTLTNNIISGPSHFLRQIIVTVPTGFTITGPVTVQAPAAAPLPWKATVNGQTITVVSGSSNDSSVTAGQSVIVTVPAVAPSVACPGKSYVWGISANQAIGGGAGNSYLPTPGSEPPTVKVGCDTQTNLTLDIAPDSIITTNTAAMVTLTSTLTRIDTNAALAGELIKFELGGQPISCNGGPALTNGAGLATCSFTPQAGPTPLPSGVYDAYAKFAGDTSTAPQLGSSAAGPVKLNVNATGTGLDVDSLNLAYSAVPQPVTLTATLTALGSPLSGKTVSFMLGSTSVGSAVTNVSGIATLSTSLPALSPGTTSGYIKANFAADGVYSAANGAGDVTIGKIPGAISFDNASLTQTYTGGQLSPTVITNPPGLSFTWTGYSQKDAGSYAVTATLNDPNYAGTVSGTFTIKPANAAIVVTNYNVNYDALPHSITSAVATGVQGEDLSAALTTTSTHTDAGNYTDNWFFNPGPNYLYASGSVVDVINKASSFVTVTGGSFTYNGSAHPATAVAGTSVGSLTNPSAVTIAYSGSCAGAAPVTVAQGLSCTATGTYLGDANHNGSTGTDTITIKKADQTITFNSIIVTASAGGPVTFSSGTPGICSVTPLSAGQATVTLLSGGSWSACQVLANQGGTSDYNAATTETGVFTVTP